jgi:hypothetical protein
MLFSLRVKSAFLLQNIYFMDLIFKLKSIFAAQFSTVKYSIDFNITISKTNR